MEHRIHDIAWTDEAAGGAAGGVIAAMSPMPCCSPSSPRAGAGTMCPMTMTYAAVPAPALDAGGDRALAGEADRRPPDAPLRPIGAKAGVTVGMAMTEKQGGSDVRANATRPSARRARAVQGASPHRPQMVLLRADVGRFPDARLCARRPLLLSRAAHRAGRAHPHPGDAAEGQARQQVEHPARSSIAARPCRAAGRGKGAASTSSSTWCTTPGSAPSRAMLGIMRMALAQALHHASHRRVFQKIDRPAADGGGARRPRAEYAEAAVALTPVRGAGLDGADEGERALRPARRRGRQILADQTLRQFRL